MLRPFDAHYQSWEQSLSQCRHNISFILEMSVFDLIAQEQYVINKQDYLKRFIFVEGMLGMFEPTCYHIPP